MNSNIRDHLDGGGLVPANSWEGKRRSIECDPRLMRFLDHHGVDRKKYSETITVFWIDKVAEKLNELGAGVSLVEKCNTIVEYRISEPTERLSHDRISD